MRSNLILLAGAALLLISACSPAELQEGADTGATPAGETPSEAVFQAAGPTIFTCGEEASVQYVAFFDAAAPDIAFLSAVPGADTAEAEGDNAPDVTELQRTGASSSEFAGDGMSLTVEGEAAVLRMSSGDELGCAMETLQ